MDEKDVIEILRAKITDVDIADIKVCQKCIEDHDRDIIELKRQVRAIELNNKLPEGLKALENKVWQKFESNEKKYTERLSTLENIVTQNIAIAGQKKEEKEDKTETKHDLFSTISMIISTVALTMSIILFFMKVFS